jgi:transcriptional regulator with XRE-family HTH domain
MDIYPYEKFATSLSVCWMEIQQIVGANVRRYRQAANLSQWELVARLETLTENLGVDQAYISHLENGRKNPNLNLLWLIAQALGVKLSQLVEE